MPPNAPETQPELQHSQLTIVVVGLGMTAVTFMEKIIEYDTDKHYRIIVFGDEPQYAYNRVGLTQYFTHQDPEQQLMKPKLWYTESNIDARIGERVDNIDTNAKKLHTEKSGWVSYDICVLATGSKAAVPPNAPTDVEGVFCYRTIEDIEKIVKWAAREDVETASIVGGGLLGLEAAKAALDLKLEVNIFERADRLMARQLDNEASKVLESEINKLGITTNIGDCPDKVDTKLDYITKNQKITGLQLQQGGYLATDMLIYSIGISPYDQLSAASGNKIERAPRGGFLVKADMTTSVSDVYAIGECASYNGMCYGLIAPCNDMADILAKNLTSTIYNTKKAVFKGNDMSTKLKLMGVFVASFGDVFPDATKTTPLIYRDPFKNIYKKYIFSRDGKKILGGIMVGDTDDYNKVLGMTRSGRPIGCDPSELMFGAKNGEAEGVETLPDDTQICSCFNVTKGELRKAITSKGLTSVDQLKAATKAGTGCGGCVPAVTEIFESEMKASGKTVTNNLCRDFTYSRAELYSIVKIKALHTFTEIVQHCATDKTTMGCEVCKPACGSILASLYNENILDSDRGALQDTNDRFMANIQRGGLYSVVPRIPAGEITPEKLAVIADVAKDYKLYSKITGAQRIDLFGARKEDLPDIWEKLVNAGFESGQAYGKSLRAVKSCVGSTWCRYGQQDSVGFAIALENRYRGIRSPHKLKGGVSGCIRECSEAQGKDFGLIATEKGYNVYIGGNGGAKPRHADLLVTNVTEQVAVTYIDRFLMYYIQTADKLQRTARWLEKLPGGIDYLRKVIIDDHLGICEELDKQMSFLVGTYEDEWAKVVNTPALRDRFKANVNGDNKKGKLIEMIEERGQMRPANWPKEVEPLKSLKDEVENKSAVLTWNLAGSTDLFPKDEGRVVNIGDVQIAVFQTLQGKFYATQNMCPVKRDLVLSSGILGQVKQENRVVSYVSCPIHKKNFDIQSGACVSEGSEHLSITTFDVKVEDNQVYLLLPPIAILDEVLGSEKTIIKRSMSPKKIGTPIAAGGSMDW